MERAKAKVQTAKKYQTKRSKPETYFPESAAWLTFVKSIKSEYTLSYYVIDMRRFIAAMSVKSPDDLLTLEKQVLQKRIINYVIARQEEGGIRAQSMAKELSSVRRFFAQNDRTDINWTIIRGYLKEAIKAVKDRAYTREEIAKMLEHADLRTRVVILLMASSGMRIGAIPGLKLRHLVSFNDKEPGQALYGIIVYEKTADEYMTYCSPECRKAIDAYVEYRTRHGEPIAPNAPLIREQFDPEDKIRVLNPRHIGRETVSSLTKLTTYKTGLRTKAKNRYERKETMLNHGLRKFFFKTCGKAKVDPVIREYLMGHKVGDIRTGVTKLMMTYDATEDNEALKEYLRVVDDLTINEENRLQKQVKVLEVKAKAAEKVEQLERAFTDSRLEADMMTKRLAEQEAVNQDLAAKVSMLLQAEQERQELEKHKKEIERIGKEENP